MGILAAFCPWGFVKGIADKEMGTGENPLGGIPGKAGLAADGAVFLGIGFIPMLSGKNYIPQISQPFGLVGEFAKNGYYLAGMNSRQPGLERRCSFRVIEFGKKSQLIYAAADNTFPVSLHIPLVVIIFDARHRAMPIMFETGVHGGGVKRLAMCWKEIFSPQRRKERKVFLFFSFFASFASLRCP